jgi:ribosomal protein L29
MKALKLGELRRLTPPELAEREQSLRSSLLKGRIQHSQRQFPKTADLQSLRRNIARVLTVRAERGRAGKESQA